MTYYTIRLCAGGGAYEAVPTPRNPLDLTRVRAVLETHGVQVVDARVMLIASTTYEFTVSRDGRILIKTRDPEAAEKLFHELGAWLDLPRAEPAS